jgi:hypothetical protein
MMIQIAHMDCAKDRHDLLEQTIMPKLDEHVRAMQNISVIVVHDKTNLEQRKSHLVPNNIDMNSIIFTPENKLVCLIEGSEEQVEVDVDLWEDSSCWNLVIATKVMSKWNDLYVGDLAFLALCLGMVSSNSCHCIFCERNGRTFNCDCHAEEQRANDKILTCHLEFEADFQRHELRRTKQTINNVKGINSQFSLPINPIKIIVPILHVPMGLVDKVLEHHLHWLRLNVKRLVGAEQMTRQRHRDSSAVLVISQRNLDDARALLTILNTPDTRIEVSEAQANKNSASSTNAKSKKAFEALTKNRNGRPESLKSRMEAIYRRWKILREHCHGGKFNGVSCIRIGGIDGPLDPANLGLVPGAPGDKFILHKVDVSNASGTVPCFVVIFFFLEERTQKVLHSPHFERKLPGYDRTPPPSPDGSNRKRRAGGGFTTFLAFSQICSPVPPESSFITCIASRRAETSNYIMHLLHSNNTSSDLTHCGSMTTRLDDEARRRG